MAKRVIDGFELEQAVVLCPECQTPFSTEIVVHVRKANSSDVIEADMHRVFNDAELRAALLSCCPNCRYCGWASTFKPFPLKPELIRLQAKIEASKKYALAVKWAREKKVHSLDIAFIALNGLWCAREAGEPDNLWLELAIYEHEKGVSQSPSCPQDDGMTHLIMGELYRQHKDFDKALAEYELALQDESISKEILRHQAMLAKRGQYGITALPLKIARNYFEIEDTPSEGNALLDFKPPTVFAPETQKIDSVMIAAPAEQAPAASAESVQADNARPLVAAISSLFSDHSNLLAAYQEIADQYVTAAPLSDAEDEISEQNVAKINAAPAPVVQQKPAAPAAAATAPQAQPQLPTQPQVQAQQAVQAKPAAPVIRPITPAAAPVPTQFVAPAAQAPVVSKPAAAAPAQAPAPAPAATPVVTPVSKANAPAAAAPSSTTKPASAPAAQDNSASAAAPAAAAPAAASTAAPAFVAPIVRSGLVPSYVSQAAATTPAFVAPLAATQAYARPVMPMPVIMPVTRPAAVEPAQAAVEPAQAAVEPAKATTEAVSSESTASIVAEPTAKVEAAAVEVDEEVAAVDLAEIAKAALETATIAKEIASSTPAENAVTEKTASNEVAAPVIKTAMVHAPVESAVSVSSFSTNTVASAKANATETVAQTSTANESKTETAATAPTVSQPVVRTQRTRTAGKIPPQPVAVEDKAANASVSASAATTPDSTTKQTSTSNQATATTQTAAPKPRVADPATAPKAPPPKPNAKAPGSESAEVKAPVRMSQASVITAPPASTVSLSVTVSQQPAPAPVIADAPKKRDKRNKRTAREDHYFARLPVADKPRVAASGWINDYANEVAKVIQPRVEARPEAPAEARVAPVAAVTPASAAAPVAPVVAAAAASSSAVYNNEGQDEAGAPLPGLAIDDTEAGRARDYSDAINRVESYLSFSRKIYSRNWMKL